MMKMTGNKTKLKTVVRERHDRLSALGLLHLVTAVRAIGGVVKLILTMIGLTAEAVIRVLSAALEVVKLILAMIGLTTEAVIRILPATIEVVKLILAMIGLTTEAVIRVLSATLEVAILVLAVARMSAAIVRMILTDAIAIGMAEGTVANATRTCQMKTSLDETHKVREVVQG
ncbi:hypothetical protein NUW58_g6862 [Xylaria curta]|uniref:Uncharacterized protein n=1 Tax=Xylaria curta TaxID=42375 RepID=A0ACC1NQ89_9PEZI|nr:hypothetical protein NUW58_g6862 [Xylaria curta]